jgi:cytochrome c oxidase assembly factor 6
LLLHHQLIPQMSADAAPPFPSRAERKACWGARDAYYACLDSKNVTEPGTETGGACDPQMKEYAGSCARSWVRELAPSRRPSCSHRSAVATALADKQATLRLLQVEYFNKRRVLEFELRARVAAEESRGTDVSGIRCGLIVLSGALFCAPPLGRELILPLCSVLHLCP